MRKQIFSILIGVVFMITLSFTTAPAIITSSFAAAKADNIFNLMPATTKHIMATAKLMKADKTLKVLVISYSEKIDYKNVDDMVDSAKAVKDAYLHVDIDTNRVVLGFANVGSTKFMTGKYKNRIIDTIASLQIFNSEPLQKTYR